MAFKITTTGNSNPVVLDDLGGRSIPHPTVDLDLELEYTIQELSTSQDLKNALVADLTAEDANDNDITKVGNDQIMLKEIYDEDDDGIVDKSGGIQRIGWRMSPTANGLINMLGWDVLTASAASLTSAVPVNMGEPAFHSHVVILVSVAVGLPFTIRITGRSIDETTTVETPGDTEDIAVAANGSYQSVKSWIDDVQISIVEASKSCTIDIRRITYWDKGNTKFKITGIRLEWTPDVAAWNIDFHLHKVEVDGSMMDIVHPVFASTDSIPRAGNDAPGKYKIGNLSVVINGTTSEGLLLEVFQTNIGNFYMEAQYEEV